MDDEQEIHFFLCPITNQIMYSPVMAEDGHMYEEEAIKKWFLTKESSPKTNLPMGTRLLVNVNFNQKLQDYILKCTENGIVPDIYQLGSLEMIETIESNISISENTQLLPQTNITSYTYPNNNIRILPIFFYISIIIFLPVDDGYENITYLGKFLIANSVISITTIFFLYIKSCNLIHNTIIKNIILYTCHSLLFIITITYVFSIYILLVYSKYFYLYIIIIVNIIWYLYEFCAFKP